MDDSVVSSHTNGLEIAVIGMACRFPGARNVDEFWCNLQAGVESITFFSDEELLASGLDPAVLNHPDYVRAKGALDDIELFDAPFFGFNPREAEIIDPQHRIFLECTWEALEHAGYDSTTYGGSIGVYAGAGMNTYLLNNLYRNQDVLVAVGGLQALIGNDKDYLTTRVSYKLDLQGPAVTIQTACSTSLVATHLACQSLLSGECDIALAGGVSAATPQKAGYLYQEGSIFSPDGHCRAFDARAQGTVSGNGVGVVVLKRLADALAEGDSIYAIIKGSAINNDGSAKVGYTAPGIRGQVKAIKAAMITAEVEPESISYIETHGTGTVVGDPIEITALTQVFRARTEKKSFCALGSVKTNIGHLDTAAGIAGLIKTILMLKHRLLPPSLNFEAPNPRIDFADSPFYVQHALSEWKSGAAPRRAGVSSFGVGGTNAHVILEEAVPGEVSQSLRPWHLVVLSARTATALEASTSRLGAYLQQHPEVLLADLAYTLQVGRRAFAHRRILICRDHQEAAQLLETHDSQRVFTQVCEQGERPVAFMFPGQGAQFIGMMADLYQAEPVFREQLDYCAALLRPHLNCDLREVLYPPEGQKEAAAQLLEQTWLTQPVLFVIEYALARVWLEWGVQPQALIGHSLGEYVAACLAGVFSLEEALPLVATRGRLMQSLPAGAMLSVALPEHEITSLLSLDLSLAALNGPSLCVVSGPTEAVAALQTRLTAQEISCRQLHTSHAFHSAMLDPIIEPFIEEIKKIKLKPPVIPYISNITGTWITAGEATDPAYWGRQLRESVRFAEGIQELWQEPKRILLEVGPGQVLSTLARAGQTAEQLVLSSARRPKDSGSDQAALLSTLGKLWLAGAQVNWQGVHAHERLHRIAAPTYPYERKRYWVDPKEPVRRASSRAEVDEEETSTRADSSEERPAILHSRAHLLNPYVAPSNEIESSIADVWQELLGLEQVGIYDDYLELGGHSLLAARIVARLRDIFEIPLPLPSFFEASTIAELARVIEEILIEKVEALSEEEIQDLL